MKKKKHPYDGMSFGEIEHTKLPPAIQKATLKKYAAYRVAQLELAIKEAKERGWEDTSLINFIRGRLTEAEQVHRHLVVVEKLSRRKGKKKFETSSIKRKL